MSTTKAVLIQEFGVPSQVAKVAEVPVPALQPGDVRVRVAFAPINPADLNLIEGKYGIRPDLPAVVGGEGVGVVEDIGNAVTGISPGDHVLLPHRVGVWRERVIVAADRAVVVPREIDLRQASMLRVNPVTAWGMLHLDGLRLRLGDCVLQNASNSGVGRAVIQLARHRNVHTINLVRRPELIDELRAIGADEVFLDNADATECIAAAKKGFRTPLALNAVGGESAQRLADGLDDGGTLLTYGAMGRKPVRVSNRLLIFRDIRFRGYWVTQEYQRMVPEQRAEMFGEIFELARSGRLSTPVEAVYPLEQCAEALSHASRSGRSGKILFAPAGGI